MILSDLDVTHGNVVANGLRFHYVEKRPASDGERAPVVLLLHGFPECWWSWRYQFDALARAGFRVIAPDLRGYNDTEKRGPYDLDTLAADVAALAKHFSPDAPIRLVAHDWGGAVAWHFAAIYPSLLERLAVLNCPHPAQIQRALLGGRVSQLKKSWYMFFFQLPVLPERQLTRDGARGLNGVYRAHAIDPTNFSPDELAPLRAAILKPGAASAALEYYRTSMKQALAQRHRPKPPPIEAPVLLLWARDDKALGYDDLVPGTERYAPNLRVQLIERCGHFLQAEQPALVNEQLVAWLTEPRDQPPSASPTISS